MSDRPPTVPAPLVVPLLALPLALLGLWAAGMVVFVFVVAAVIALILTPW